MELAMRTSKFFRLTISGDNLDLEVLKNTIGLRGETYVKGDVVYKLSEAIPQKTNRWVYHSEHIDEESVSAFLTENLEILVSDLTVIKAFAKTNDTKIELVVYAGDNTDICLTPCQIQLLDKLGIDFYISFC